MSDNNIFFKHFFKSKDKLWNEIQNNPIAKRDLMPNWKIGRTPVYITPNQPGGNLDVWHNFNRVYADHIQVPAGNMRFVWNTGNYNVTNTNEAREVVKEAFGEVPPLFNFLPVPNTVGNLIRNLQAAVASDKFIIRPFDRNNPNYNWTKRDDYWLPQYEGNFFQLQERQSRRPPRAHSYNQKLLTNVFDLKSKQKEALVWLNSDFT